MSSKFTSGKRTQFIERDDSTVNRDSRSELDESTDKSD